MDYYNQIAGVNSDMALYIGISIFSIFAIILLFLFIMGPLKPVPTAMIPYTKSTTKNNN